MEGIASVYSGRKPKSFLPLLEQTQFYLASYHVLPSFLIGFQWYRVRIADSMVFDEFFWSLPVHHFFVLANDFITWRLSCLVYPLLLALGPSDQAIFKMFKRFIRSAVDSCPSSAKPSNIEVARIGISGISRRLFLEEGLHIALSRYKPLQSHSLHRQSLQGSSK